VAKPRDDDVVDPLVRVGTARAGENADRGAPSSLCAAHRCGHHLTEPSGDDRAPALGQEPAHFLGTSLVLGAAPDHGNLHAVIVEARHAKGGTLVLGGGFAGSYVARLLGKRATTIVSEENFMLFTPMLPEAASGSLEPRHIVVPLRMMCPHSELLLGRFTALDPEQRVATVQTETETIAVHYERAVLALGSFPRALPIPGLAEYGLGFKDIADAIYLRNHVLRRLESAAAENDRQRAEAHLTFVFVGAGYAGVEALAELSDLVRDALRYYPEFQRPRLRWVLVDAAPKILPEIPTRLGEYAAKQLLGRGVEIHTSTTLASAGPGSVVLSGGIRIATHTLVWTAGVMPNPILRELGLPVDERGAVRVDSLLRVEGHEGLWALGDCARVPNELTPGPDPPTSQHALRQARRLAKNLRGDAKPYRFRMLGQVATLGRYKGIALVFGVPFRGFIGWFITRTYHLYQLPLFSRKLRVVTDWTVSLLFRRDIAELGRLGHPRRLGDE
jgi:NADH:quinone reductase (non-electrogenic)